MATIRISEADAARDFAALMAHVRLGEEVVIENEARPVAVMRPAGPASPGRLLSEIIAAAETRASSALLDGSFARDLEEVIKSHSEPLNPSLMELIRQD
jgi:antitoxin (DNA-binding transcriptional repressor) of toxin-antitoxin stability system